MIDLSTYKQTDWRFGSSTGLSVSAGLPLKILTVSAGRGTLQVLRKTEKHVLTYHGLGAGAGLSKATPITVSVSLPAFPSGGVKCLCKGPPVTGDLKLDDMTGMGMILTFSSSLLAGGEISVVFMGMPWYTPSYAVGGNHQAIWATIALKTNAMGVIAGTSAKPLEITGASYSGMFAKFSLD